MRSRASTMRTESDGRSDRSAANAAIPDAPAPTITTSLYSIDAMGEKRRMSAKGPRRRRSSNPVDRFNFNRNSI